MGAKSSKVKTVEAFIDSAKRTHGTRYDYSKVTYKGAHYKVSIICLKHGAFLQTPANHTGKSGCFQCGVEKRTKTTEDFIVNAKQIHNNMYDYSMVNYVSGRKKVCIICPVHGRFKQIPYTHLQGTGCKECADKDRTKTTEDFIVNAKQIHGDKYDYSMVNYVNSFTVISIICRKHDNFQQIPANHLQGSGCWECANENSTGRIVYPEQTYTKAILYFVEMRNGQEQFCKIGITIYDIQTRFASEKKYYNITPLYVKNTNLYDAFKIEQKTLKNFIQFSFRPKMLSGGKTECFIIEAKQSIFDYLNS